MDSNDMSTPNFQYLHQLITTAVADGITLRSETVDEILTPKRLELLDRIATEDLDSVRDLARQLDRHPSIVSRDLDRLFDAGVIEFERDGRAKRP